MAIAPFHEKELEVIGSYRNPFGKFPIAQFNAPVNDREAVKLLYQGKPVHQIVGTGIEHFTFCPSINPDNIARAYVLDATTRADKVGQAGGPDMFGIEWEYVPEVGGSMVRPGQPLVDDANDLMEKVQWPDIESWDWEGAAEVNRNYFREDRFNLCWLMNGWYERLISMMDFEDAAVALIDEDQKDAVKAFFDKLSDLYIDILDHYIKYFPMIDGFHIHDDWGSQKDTFFAPQVAAEMLVPYMRRVTDFLHSKGKYCDLHSCGMNFKQVPNYIDAGFDSWRPQSMNDIEKIYELYGDKIIIAVPPQAFDVDNTTEEEQREFAREYAKKFCNPKKPSMFSMYGLGKMTPAYREELYKQSRLLYAEQA